MTVAELLEVPELSLRCVGGRTGLSRPIRWVHFSEVEDPVRWLQGGELVITLGLLIEDDAAWESYVRRLKAANLAAVGIGIGIRYQMIPRQLAAIADELGLPLLEVPKSTQFVAISETVSRRIAEDQYQATQQALEAQHELTAAALKSGGTPGTLEVLTRRAACWAVVVRPDGALVAAEPPESAARVGEFREDLDRCRNSSAPSAMSIGTPEEAVLVQPLGALRKARRFLLVGKDDGFTAFDRIIVAAAVTLLSLDAEVASRVTDTERFLRERTMRQLLQRGVSERDRAEALRLLGIASPSIRVAELDTAAQSPDAGISAVETAEDYLAARGLPAVCATIDPGRPLRVTALLEDREGLLDLLSQVLVRDMSGRPRIGLGRPVHPADVALGRRQAGFALDTAFRNDVPLVAFDDIGFADLVFGVIPEGALNVLVDSLITPLEREDHRQGTELSRTLHRFLASNGHWDQTARRLGVHRQTVHARIERIERLLGVDLESADTRAVLWVAFAGRRPADS